MSENISIGFERPAPRMVEKGMTTTQGPKGDTGPVGPEGPQGPVPIFIGTTPPADIGLLWVDTTIV